MSKITFKVEELKKRLAQIGSVIDKKAAIPVYSCVLLSVYDKPGALPPYGVQITGVGIAASFTTIADAAPDGPLYVLLPFEKFQKVIGGLSAPEVTLALNEEGTVVNVRAGKFSAKIQTQQHEFPTIMARPETHKAVFDLPAFIGQISKAEFAVPAADGKYTSTVAKVEAVQSSDGDKDTSTVKVVATDGHRLAIATAAKNVGTFNLVMPKEALELVKKLEGGKDVTIWENETGFMFTTEKEVLTVNRTSGEFPPYASILPTSYQTSFTVDAEALLASINRLAPLTDDESPLVVFTAADGANVLGLTAANSSTGGDSAEDEVDLVAPVAGPLVAFALNYKMLAEFLTRTSGGIHVRATDGTKVIDFVAESGSYRVLQMPKKI